MRHGNNVNYRKKPTAKAYATQSVTLENSYQEIGFGQCHTA